MSKIQTKIQGAMFSMIGISVMFVLIMLAATITVVMRNQATVDTMLLEYSLISRSEKLITSYNAYMKNPAGSGNHARFDADRRSLTGSLKTLDSKIVWEGSRNAYSGLSSTVAKLVAECDKGVSEVESNMISDASDHYGQALKYSEFVRENTLSLLESELDYVASTQEGMRISYYRGIAVFMVFFLCFSVVLFLHSRAIARGLVVPIVSLSKYAKRIAEGHLDDPAASARKVADDEIGSLEDSIYTMVQTLLGTLSDLRSANEQLEGTKRDLERKNEELGKVNNLMVGRELKMSELKNENTDLKRKLGMQTA